MVFNGEGKLILKEEISCEDEDALMKKKKKVNKWPATAGSLTCLDATGNNYQYMGSFMVNQYLGLL